MTVAVSAPVGRLTRGTTAARRLRRVDRWLVAAHPGLLATAGLRVVDLGFGASPVTTLDLAARLRGLNPSTVVTGLDIDPARVEAALPRRRPGVDFGTGGFELAGLRPHLVRAMNVLRQYDEADVPAAWRRMTGALAPGGVVVEGTCDEPGRLGAWIGLDAGGPQTLTLALDLRLPPSAVAARLPKALIHRNVAGEPVHRLLTELDAGWRRHAPLGAFGGRQRLAAACLDLRRAGWPLAGGERRWRRGEVTVAWRAVAPAPR